VVTDAGAAQVVRIVTGAPGRLEVAGRVAAVAGERVAVVALLVALENAVPAHTAARDTGGVVRPRSAEARQAAVEAGRSGEPRPREPRHQQGELHPSPFSQPAKRGASPCRVKFDHREPTLSGTPRRAIARRWDGI